MPASALKRSVVAKANSQNNDRMKERRPAGRLSFIVLGAVLQSLIRPAHRHHE